MVHTQVELEWGVPFSGAVKHRTVQQLPRIMRFNRTARRRNQTQALVTIIVAPNLYVTVAYRWAALRTG